MKVSWFSLYNLVLALWVGGIALYTFIITPLIFRSFARDTAGEIVGKLFPSYFLYNLALSAAALVLFFLVAGWHAQPVYAISLLLVTTALLINAYILFTLYPEIRRVKKEEAAFEKGAARFPGRRKFSRLHAVSAVLNLVLLVEGIALLIIGPGL